MGMFDEQQLGTPALSFKAARKGTKIEGVILPIPVTNAKTGVREMKSYREDQDKDTKTGLPKVYPSGDPIMVGQFHLSTPLRGWDLTSAEFEERTAEHPDEVDAGKRRWYVGSKYANAAVKEAFKRIRKAPEVGGHLTIVVTGIGSDTARNGEKYTFPILAVNWTDPDDEGRKVAEAHAATLEVPDSPADEMPAWAQPDSAPEF